MIKKLFLLFALPVILSACGGDDDEPEVDLFHLTVGTEADADVAMGAHSVEITINGNTRWIDFSIVGDFDHYLFSGDYPDWLTLSNADVVTPHSFRIWVSANDGDDPRTGTISFNVFKGDQMQTGTITITQAQLIPDDRKRAEHRAIQHYLSKFDIVIGVPDIDRIQVGSVAPFYQLNTAGTAYMQVVRMGTAPAATQGEKVYFRFLRYNLLSYLENGVLPEGQGNLNDPSAPATYFELGSGNQATTQWGTAIQMPMQFGLPADSEVNLVVASEAGPTAEINNVVPFLYNIRYFPSDQ